MAGLDRLYGVINVASTPLFNFKPEEGAAPFDLKSVVWGPDGAPYVIDAATSTVYRIDLKRKRATAVVREGREAKGTVVSTPRFLGVGGRDLLILDAKNVLWRWRPSNDAGKGTLNRVEVNGATQWGDDVTAIGTYLRDPERGLFNLYVIDPSEQQIRHYPPANDGSGFPTKASGWLATARDVANMTSMYIDGDIFITEGGVLERFSSGKNDGWEAKELPGHPPAQDGDRHPRGWPGGAAQGDGVHLRPRERPADRIRQGERRLSAAVSAGRWRSGLAGFPRHVHHARGRGSAVDRRVGVGQQPEPGRARGGPGRIGVAVACRLRGAGRQRFSGAVDRAVGRALNRGARRP